MDRRILIVGGAGFVGSNLVRWLLAHEPQCHIQVIDNFLSSEPFNLPRDDRVSLIEGSINEPDVLRGLKDEYDLVFHLACYHGNQSSIHNPLADCEHGLLSTLNLFQALAGCPRVKKVVYSGAGCAVAEKTFDAPQASEEVDLVSLHMDSPYSISKIVGEFYACYYHRQCGLPVVRARFQNVYGPGEVLGAGQWRGTPATIWRNVVPTFVYKSLKGEALPLENAGVATRDFIFVEEVARGLWCCAKKGIPGEAYNLASGMESSIAELAELINELTENSTSPCVKPRRSWDHSGRRYGSTTKSREVLGFEAKVALREGLEATVEWTRAHLPLIESTMAKHEALLLT